MSEFDLGPVLDVFGFCIYVGMALSTLYGGYCVIFLMRRIRQKRLLPGAAQLFLDEIGSELEKRDFDGITEICDSPDYWNKATVQLVMVAVDNRRRPPAKLRKLLAERFEREILADLEYRTSWIATIVKAAPMLGLLGTVVGMIRAFSKIASMQKSGTDAKVLADDISFALFTTAMGLSIAIPLVLAGAIISVRIGKLQDSVQEQLGGFLEDLEGVMADDIGGQSQ